MSRRPAEDVPGARPHGQGGRPLPDRPRGVVVANEYDLERNVARHAEGRYARHLLFGVQLLHPPEWVATFVGESLSGPVRHRAVRVLVTNLRAARRVRDADAVLATYTYGALLAGLLARVVRRTGRVATVVTVVHGLPGLLRRRARLTAWLLRGHAGLAFLNPADLAVIGPHLHPDQRAVFLPWGPASDWLGDAGTSAGPAGSADPYVLVVGKSKRDWATLAAAHAVAPFPLVVVAGAECPLTSGPDLVVHRPAPGQREALSLDAFRRTCREAAVVVLPLLESSTLNGLTALGEALATGAPVVMAATATMAPLGRHYGDRVTLVPPGDPGALAGAVAAALASPPPAPRSLPPTAEAAEDVLLALLRGDPLPGAVQEPAPVPA